jgi:alkyldihydroxyacetonephosphate synthase
MPVTPPIALEGEPTLRPLAPQVPLPDGFAEQLPAVVDIDNVEVGRDWWPLAMTWALDGQVPGRAAVVVRPTTTEQVATILRLCSEHHVPITAAGGRSGVVGASVPVHGGVVLDTTGMAGLVDVDDASLTIEVLPGTFGDELEAELREAHGLTLGHWPQSVAISTVGGWLACRSAGQLSTRYGKIEDMVVGLEVVLADGTVVRTGGAPRAAVGPDLNQLFVGSEGTLGVITRAWLRCHPVPPADARAAYGFPTMEAGLDACRRILRRGATPAVLRLYDPTESQRSHGTDLAVLLVYDEAEPALLDATMSIAAEECAAATALDPALVEGWFHHRNDVSALEALTRKGFVVDTMEVAGPWSALPQIYADVITALGAVEHNLAASAHVSHSYGDGACLYFSFAGRPPADQKDAYYVAAWDAAARATLAAGGVLSHHHGVGLHRSRFMHEALGAGLGVLAAVKAALDPAGVLNPGKLGLPDPFGAVTWPS